MIEGARSAIPLVVREANVALLPDRARRDHRQRMRTKRNHGRRPPGLAPALDHAADDRLMPDVHAVEVPDRGDAAARKVGLPERVVEN